MVMHRLVAMMMLCAASVPGVFSHARPDGSWHQRPVKTDDELVRASATSGANTAPAPPVPCFNSAQGCSIDFDAKNLSQHKFSGFGADL
eukprot:COSAG03_NODE_627_length_6647_cov_68.678375_8_plen_89_part_00